MGRKFFSILSKGLTAFRRNTFLAWLRRAPCEFHLNPSWHFTTGRFQVIGLVTTFSHSVKLALALSQVKSFLWCTFSSGDSYQQWLSINKSARILSALTFYETEKIFWKEELSPPSVVMSQYTENGISMPLGSSRALSNTLRSQGVSSFVFYVLTRVPGLEFLLSPRQSLKKSWMRWPLTFSMTIFNNRGIKKQKLSFSFFWFWSLHSN